MGTVFAMTLRIPTVESASVDSRYIRDVMAAVSVGTSILLMVTTNTEHLPAAGTAFGLVIHGWSWSALAFVVFGAIALSALSIALRNRLVDLV